MTSWILRRPMMTEAKPIKAEMTPSTAMRISIEIHLLYFCQTVMPGKTGPGPIEFIAYVFALTTIILGPWHFEGTFQADMLVSSTAGIELQRLLEYLLLYACMQSIRFI